VAPLDAVGRGERVPTGGPDVGLAVNRKTLAEGDALVVKVANHADRKVYVELVMTGVEGDKVVLTPEAVTVEAGKTLEKKYKVQAGTGKEQVTVYASDKPFETGEVLALPAGEREKGVVVADRVVHRQFYQLKKENGRYRLPTDGAGVVKKTVEIETQ
jgi:serine/threonine-protein kinase